MSFGFQNTGMLLVLSDGRNAILQEPLVYVAKDGRTYRAPIGTTTDGLSTPPAAWFEIAPFGYRASDGTWRGWKSGILHDAGYRAVLECKTPAGNWVKVDFFDQAQCDNLISEALESEGVPGELRVIVFEALRALGGKAFRDDRQKPAVD